MANFNEILRKNLTCPTCQNLFIDPVIATCCNQTFCISCVGNASRCPLHKKTSHFTPNRTVANMVDELPYECPCGNSILRKDRQAHENSCPKIIKSCNKCKFSGNLDDRIRHFIDVHSGIIIEMYSEIV